MDDSDRNSAKKDEDYELWMDSILHPWGEIPKNHGVLPEELQAQLIVQSMKDPILLSSSTPRMKSESVVVPPECTKMDETVMSTVRLRQHAKHLKDLIEIAEKRTDSRLHYAPLPPASEIPPITMSWKKKKASSFNSQQEEDLQKDVPISKRDEVFELTRDNARKILRKAVAAIFSAQGFDSASCESLDIMTEVAETYMDNFVKALRIASDKESVTGCTGFQNLLERVYAEMGAGSTSTLKTFYENYVIPNLKDALKSCKSLAEIYENARTPSKPIKIEPLLTPKAEIMDVEEDIVSQIHFPAVDESYLSNQLQPSLELGFQMLQSLELAEHMQNVKQEENITFHTPTGYTPMEGEDSSSSHSLQTSQDSSLPFL